MSINIQAKSDVSYLFSGLGSNISNVASSNFLADYASIKNGSYGKLMKAYYSETASDEVKSLAKNSRVKNALSAEETKSYAKVQTTADGLKESADALLDKKLFEKKDITTKNEDGTETTVKGYDTDAIYKAVNSVVTDYNSVLKAAADTDDNTLSRRVATMQNATVSNLKMLSKIGISVSDKDGTLSIDKDAFEKADMSKVKSLFNENGSYGYQISAQASLINYAADRAVNKGSTYNAGGSYSAYQNSGNLFSSYF